MRISDWLLLLLRCLLIGLLAVLLSHPVWQRTLTRGQRGWIILEDGAYPHFKSEIDSLLESGCQLHRFDAAFNRIHVNHLPSGDTTTLGYWQLLKTLEAQLPAGFPLYVYSGSQQRRFYGRRPELDLQVQWKVYADNDTVNNWNAYTYPLANGAAMAITGHSGAAYTYYTRQQVPVANMAPLKICVYTDQYKSDADAVIYALQTVQQFTGINLSITTTKPAGENYDWICWLSDAALPATTNGKVLKYATGKPISTNASAGSVGIFKYIPAQTSDSVVLYDTYHHPLITYNNNAYTLYTHVNREWCSLPDNGQFPEILLHALLPVPPAAGHDLRAVAAAQLTGPAAVASNTKMPVNDTTDLQQLCWILIFLVFALERYLALKTPKTNGYGEAGI